MASLRIPPKNSILKRPKRNSSTAARSNAETADEQYRLEQERLQRLRAKRQQLVATRGTLLYGTAQQKAEMNSREQASIDELRRHKELQQERTREQETRIAQEMYTRDQAANESLDAQHEARKHYNQQLLQENKRLLRYREQLKQQTKQQEIEYEKQLAEDFESRWRPNAL